MNKKHIIGSLVGSSSVLALGLVTLFLLLSSIDSCGPGCAGGVGIFAILIAIFFGTLTILVFISLLFTVNKHSKQKFKSLSKFIIDACKWLIALPIGMTLFGFFSNTQGRVGATELLLLLSPLLSGVIAAILCWLVIKPHNKKFKFVRSAHLGPRKKRAAP